MDYHVVAYTNYELVGLPLPKLWDSFSLLQVKHGQSFPLKQFKKNRWFNTTLADGIVATSILCLG